MKATDTTVDLSAIAFDVGTRRRFRVEHLIYPMLIFLAVFYVVPVAAMLWRSVSDPTLSLQHYAEAFTTGVFYQVFFITLRIALLVTVSALIIAYPLAYTMATAPPSAQRILMSLVLIPFWISVLVRTYSWMVLLGREGPINQLLMFLHVTSSPVRLLNTTFATVLGMLQIMLPFMILPLFNSLRDIDRRLISAAQNLGAPPWQIFFRIIFPLSLPGVFAGCLLVFIISIGSYVTPALLGGERDVMVGVLIADQVSLLHWGLAATLATVLLAIVLAVVAIADRWLGIEKLFGTEQ